MIKDLNKFLSEYLSADSATQKKMRIELRKEGKSIKDLKNGLDLTPKAVKLNKTIETKDYSNLDRTKLKPSEMLKLIEDLWISFNNENYFDEEMIKPKFRVKNTKRQLGCWNKLRREISISSYLIRYSDYKTLTEVIRHEMAHQYVSEILELIKEGHGSNWKRIAVRAKVNPSSRTEANIDSPVEAEKRERIKEIIKKDSASMKLVAYSEIPRVHSFNPKPFVVAQYFDHVKCQWIKGLIVAFNDQKGRRCAFIAEGRRSSATWQIIPTSWLYEAKLNKKEVDELEFYANTIFKSIEIQKNTRGRRSRWGF